MVRVFLLLCFILSLTSHAQIDSLKRGEVKPQRGIYLSYDEFVKNCPSIVTDFTSNLIYRDIDTTVIGSQFRLIDSSRFLPPIWGFCDGNYAFIALYTNRNTTFWKLSFFGRNPYFLISFRANAGPAGPFPINLFGYAIQYEAYKLMMLDKNGEVQLASYSHIKKLFVSNPSLLKNFKSETNISDNLKKEYLKKFNFE